MITQEDIDAMRDGMGLVDRLRGRAESERAIQLNNEAVWDCLKHQLEAFERKDGTHNAFALRLGLDHRNCAEHDAKLAADWDEAADRIQQLERELDIARNAATMHHEMWAAEKALADRLYAYLTDERNDDKGCMTAYRKARGL